MLACHVRTNEVQSCELHNTLSLLQEPMRFVFTCQASTVEVLFMFADEYKYVDNSLNSICSSYKVIVSLQKMWTKPLYSYAFIL